MSTGLKETKESLGFGNCQDPTSVQVPSTTLHIPDALQWPRELCHSYRKYTNKDIRHPTSECSKINHMQTNVKLVIKDKLNYLSSSSSK